MTLVVNCPPGSQPYNPRARHLIVRANQEPNPSAIARELVQNGANEIARSVMALDLNRPTPIKPAQAWTLVMGRDADGFLHLVRSASPHQQVWNPSRIVQNPDHGPRWQKRNLFAKLTLRPKNRPALLYRGYVRSPPGRPL